MAKLRKLRETELIGGKSNEDLYPVTVAMGVIDKLGNNLQDYLTEILKTYLFGGVVGTNDSPLDNELTNVFYLGLEPGTYKYFNNFINGPNEICIFTQSKGNWAVYHINSGSGGGSSLPVATDDALGGIKTGYSEHNDCYAVRVDSDGKAYVCVPTGGGGGTDPDPGDISVTGVTLSPSSVSIAVGGYKMLTAIVQPSNATDKTVTWSSDKPEIASVTNTGRVTGESEGTATITVTTNDGSKTDTCIVTVTAPIRSYFGVVSDDFVVNEQNIKENTEELNLSSKNYIATVEMDYQKTLYAYPKKYGALDSIKDANGFEYLLSYTRTELSINGEQYYVYLLTDAATIPMFKQTYS